MKPFKEFAFDYMEQLQHALDHVNLNKVKEAVDLIKGCRGTVWLIGNGGSASLASHMATDLQLAEVRAIALTDVAAVTTYSNDVAYGKCFSKQLQVLAKQGDLIIVISGSGNSENIINAIGWGLALSIKTISVVGLNGGDAKAADLCLHVPAKNMGVSQDGHQVILHMICYYLMEERRERKV